MQDQAKAKIFLAAERGHNETEWFRSYSTFNFGRYQNRNKTAFAGLYVWNDDTLAPGKSIRLLAEENTTLVVLPVVGGVLFKDSAGNEAQTEAGESLVVAVAKGTSVEISNPYADELVNFVHGWMKTGAVTSEARVSSFALDQNKNKLVKAFSTANNATGFIGKFDGRKEGTYRLENDTNGVFVFILQGAFEVQNRLLEARDGLALWDTGAIEFEALSNEAILFFLELPL